MFNFDSEKSALVFFSSFNIHVPVSGINGRVGIFNQNLHNGQYLDFDGGTVDHFNTPGFMPELQIVRLKGRLEDFTSRQRVWLQDGDVVDLSNFLFTPIEFLVGTGSGFPTARIIGEPLYTWSIIVNDTATLELGFRSALNFKTVHTVGNSILKLVTDLNVEVGFITHDPATSPCKINLNGQRLKLTNLDFNNVGGYEFVGSTGVIELGGRVGLNGPLIFSTSGDFYIKGNGNIMNCTSCSQVPFQATVAGVKLHFENIVLKLGDEAPFSTSAGNFSIKLDGGVALDFTSSLKIDSGLSSSIDVVGDDNKIFVRNHTFDVGSGWTLNIADNKELVYQVRQNFSQGKVVSSGSGSINLGNGSRLTKVQSVANDSSSDEYFMFVSDNITLTRDHDFSLNSGIFFKNADFVSPKTIVMDGGGHTLTFPKNNAPVLFVDGNTTVVMQNVRLKGYYPEAVFYNVGGAPGRVKFGDKVAIELDRNISLSSSLHAMSFAGNATVSSKDKVLSVLGNDLLLVDGGSKVTFSGVRLRLGSYASVRCLSSFDTIVFKDGMVVFDSDWQFALGNVEIEGCCSFVGRKNTSGRWSFDFESTGNFMIKSGAVLSLFGDVNFNYKANPFNDGLNTAATKRHLVMVDETSTIHLQGGSITSTETALAIDQGMLIIEKESDIFASSTVGAEFELSENVKVKIKDGSFMNVNGPLLLKPRA